MTTSQSLGQNRRIIDIADRNINNGFDLATALAGAKDLARGRGIAGRLLAEATGLSQRPHKGRSRAIKRPKAQVRLSRSMAKRWCSSLSLLVERTNKLHRRFKVGSQSRTNDECGGPNGCLSEGLR